MVKGTQKQMVVVKTQGNRFYEQAYFVLRDGQCLSGESETTMLAEANRILDESMLLPGSRRRRMRRTTAFLWGLALGTIVATVVTLVLVNLGGA